MNHAGRLISQVCLSFSICLAVLFLVLGNILAVWFLSSLMWRRRQNVDECRQLPANNPADWLSFSVSLFSPRFLVCAVFFRLPVKTHREKQITKRNHYWKWKAKWCKSIHIHLRRDLIPLVNKLKWIMNAWMCSITQYYACNRALGPCISSTGSAKYNRKNGPEKRYYI